MESFEEDLDALISAKCEAAKAVGDQHVKMFAILQLLTRSHLQFSTNDVYILNLCWLTFELTHVSDEILSVQF